MQLAKLPAELSHTGQRERGRRNSSRTIKGTSSDAHQQVSSDLVAVRWPGERIRHCANFEAEVRFDAKSS
uniref:Uncharacterized protein n=1 Tax=Macrostomum lignano TaxID=282301 RepID=A0A1I8HFF5_9PLAT